jgi:endonuclease/exonuclease/phosphatase family metal-dependent hydrolase
VIRAFSWNLFHGRDHPPDPALFTWRSRLLRVTERNETHLQVNRDLFPEFAGLTASVAWDVALLQECPPRWVDRLAAACDAQAHSSLTSRNSLPRLRSLLARLNPDLIASNEGGSNTTLVRGGGIADRRELVLATSPERRTMAFTRLASGLCVANLHASTADVAASAELHLAADQSIEWAGDDPLILGGDFNIRPDRSPETFAALHERGFSKPHEPAAIDHLLARGIEVVEPPTSWAPERREVPERGLAIRLSDHAPVEAAFTGRER